MTGFIALPGGGIEEGLLCCGREDGFSFGWDLDRKAGSGVDTKAEVSLWKLKASWRTKQSCISCGGFGIAQTTGTGEEVLISAVGSSSLPGSSVADFPAG